MALLGDYINTYQRVNPAQGLLQGFNQGSQFMFALQQQKMQQQQLEEQKKEKERSDDMKQVAVLLEAAPKLPSSTGKTQLMQNAMDILSKYNPSLRGVVFTLDDTAKNFMSKARGLKKILVENPDLGLKEIDNLLQEAAKEEDAKNLDKQQHKEIVDSVSGVKKEAAAEMGGDIAFYNQYEKEKGVPEFQQEKLAQMINTDPELGMKMQTALHREQAQDSTKRRDAYQDDAVMTRIVNQFNADPNVRKVEQMDQFANLITDVSNSDNPIGHASLETLMARASGEVGNLSEADKKPFGGSRALTERMKQTFSELYKGRKTPENLKFIADLADTFRQTGQKKKLALARQRSAQYARANRSRGWTPQEVFGALAPGENYEEIPSKPSVSRTPTATKRMIFNPATGSFE